MRAPTIRARVLSALIALAAVSATGRADAQALAQRVRSAGNGFVELNYASRPGVCGDGRHFFSMGGNSYFGEWSTGRVKSSCVPGPARVRMRVERGTVTELHAAVGPQASYEERATNLGEVGSADAASFFLSLADTSNARVAHGAITAAVLADSTSVWRRLLTIASDTSRVSGSTRRDALFWVGRFVAAKITGHGEDVTAVEDDGDRDDTRDAAVFALSQLRGKQGVEPLLQIARSHKDPQVRQKAIFWLGQSGDPRAVRLFAEILRG
jgi:hypothetical protein